MQEVPALTQRTDLLRAGQAKRLDFIVLDPDIRLRKIAPEFIDVHEIIVLLGRAVAAVRVDAAALLHREVKPCFLGHLPEHRLLRTLPGPDAAAGNLPFQRSPFLIRLALRDEDAPCPIADQRQNRQMIIPRLHVPVIADHPAPRHVLLPVINIPVFHACTSLVIYYDYYTTRNIASPVMPQKKTRAERIKKTSSLQQSLFLLSCTQFLMTSSTLSAEMSCSLM